jgi:hypothetical protein
MIYLLPMRRLKVHAIDKAGTDSGEFVDEGEFVQHHGDPFISGLLSLRGCYPRDVPLPLISRAGLKGAKQAEVDQGLLDNLLEGLRLVVRVYDE